MPPNFSARMLINIVLVANMYTGWSAIRSLLVATESIYAEWLAAIIIAIAGFATCYTAMNRMSTKPRVGNVLKVAYWVAVSANIPLAMLGLISLVLLDGTDRLVGAWWLSVATLNLLFVRSCRKPFLTGHDTCENDDQRRESGGQMM